MRHTSQNNNKKTTKKQQKNHKTKKPPHKYPKITQKNPNIILKKLLRHPKNLQNPKKTQINFKQPKKTFQKLVICGLGRIDVEDWRRNTRLKHCTSSCAVVRWFWRAVEAFDQERRARLLQFVTGSSKVPFQGFKALQGGFEGYPGWVW